MSQKSLNIEVLGIGFPNKGAELMLCAVQDWASQLGRKVRLVVNWHSPVESRMRYGLWTKIWHPPSQKVPYGKVAAYMPAGWRNKLGVVRDEDIDLYLDASGYAYGDPWGAPKAWNRLGERIALWKSLGKPTVLLPQAFGPFENPELRRIMKHIVEHAHSVYARDSISERALLDVCGSRPNIKTGPDFSCLVQTSSFAGVDEFAGAIGLIPNHKTYEMGNGLSKESYVQMFVDAAADLLAKGSKVALILHEGEKDMALCTEIQKRSGGSASLIKRTDPREIKAAIGACAAVVTSRFHGFASSLFQGVPVLATSWSHKYLELAASFGHPEFVVSDLPGKDVAVRVLAMIEKPTRNALHQDLISVAGIQKEQTRKMWSELEQLVK